MGGGVEYCGGDDERGVWFTGGKEVGGKEGGFALREGGGEVEWDVGEC